MATHRLPAPQKLHATQTGARKVVLAWRPVRGASGYEVLRGRKVVARVKKARWTDRTPKAGDSVRYRVRALDARGRRSPAGRTLLVRVPRPSAAPPVSAGVPTAPGSTSGGTPAPAPPSTPPAGPVLDRAMVDRVFWRAGFGPSDADRQAWTGRRVTELVDHLLDTPQSFDPSLPSPVTQTNGAIDPLATRDELVMEWIDAMQRARNPLSERLAFFLHRLWAVSIADGIDHRFMLAYRDRLRRFGDLAATPDASFRDLAREMTMADSAMSLFLTGYANTRYGVNENYAREFLELFCLGVRNGAGEPNYAQSDVRELARAFTGWRFNWDSNSPDYGAVTLASWAFDPGTKTLFGQTAAWDAASAIDLVLARPAHAEHLVRKLWAEFIVTPIPDDALASLCEAYVGGGTYRLRPLVRGILTHPLLFESLAEPNMVKPPVVFWVGAAKALASPQKWYFTRDALDQMQQVPYLPPNVAGWEGGLSWLNTNTTRARFEAIQRMLYTRHRPTTSATDNSGYPGAVALNGDDPAQVGATADDAFDIAYAACGSPWLSAAAATQLRLFSAAHPAATKANREQRQYALRTLILGGPDAQVM